MSVTFSRSFLILFVDECGQCTNGSTNKTFNYLKDCMGLCDKAVNDSCGYCQLKEKMKNYTDCNGVCNGQAYINPCNFCVNGTTGLANDHGEFGDTLIIRNIEQNALPSFKMRAAGCLEPYSVVPLIQVLRRRGGGA